MGVTVQIFPTGVTTRVRARKCHPRHVLLFAWTALVAVPWVLQIRSFSQLAARHKITQNLVPVDGAPLIKTESDVVARCPANGLLGAGVWYRIYPTHYYENTSKADGSVLCHFIMPQYNAHGMYNIQPRKVTPMPSASRSCATSSYAVNYYYYHGSIGYFALYSEGEGSYCEDDTTMHTEVTGVGSNDINFSALAHYDGAPGYHSSSLFTCVGILWLVYRAIVLTRSFRSCSRYGRRLEALNESISIFNATVYAQQAARLAPHTATNWHRLAIVYLLVEGIMTDLFLVIAFAGFGAKLQYISLGYNSTGLLSILFEIIENSTLMKAPTRLLIKRVLFNSEMAMKGELLFSIVMAYYITAVNRSDLRNTAEIAEAVSYYAWSLFNHGVIVVGQTASIMMIRLIGTLVYVQWRYGSLKMLVAPCCVDSVMGYRCKLMKISGYNFKDSRLSYTKETLKAHGLLKAVDEKGCEYLVYHKIYWLPSTETDLVVLGKLTGEHVDPWPESHYMGPVAVCDRVLGGVSADERELTSNDLDELESARLVHSAIEPRNSS